MRSPCGKGSAGSSSTPMTMNAEAPIAMATAMATPPTSVSQRCLASIRTPRRASRDRLSSQRNPRASRPSSLYFSTPPKLTCARRRASCGSRPSTRRRRSASIWMWRRISSCMSASSCFERRSARHTDRRRRPRSPTSDLLGRCAECHRHSVRDPVPARGLIAEARASAARESIELRAAVVV